MEVHENIHEEVGVQDYDHLRLVHYCNIPAAVVDDLDNDDRVVLNQAVVVRQIQLVARFVAKDVALLLFIFANGKYVVVVGNNLI